MKMLPERHGLAVANIITGAQNPLVKSLVSLRKKRLRVEKGVFLIEGERELLHALAGGIEFETIVFCRELLVGNAELTSMESLAVRFGIGGTRAVETVEVSPRVYEKIAVRENTEGIVGVAKIPKRDIHTLPLSKNPLVLVAVGIEKPGNLGALLRTADGAGVDVLIVCGAEVDLYNPNVIRSSLGALFTVPTFSLSWEETWHWLQENRIRMIFTSPAGENEYTEEDYTGAVAICLGSEKEGLPSEWLRKKNSRVRIPMQGQMDSLNTSCSGAIVLYEAVRQREWKRGQGSRPPKKRCARRPSRPVSSLQA
jgi:RNA methyltransferase, TrmH family